MNYTMSAIMENLKFVKTIYQPDVVTFVKEVNVSYLCVFTPDYNIKISRNFDNKEIDFVCIIDAVKKYGVQFVDKTIDTIKTSKISVVKTDELGVYNLLDTNNKFITTISCEYVNEVCSYLKKIGENDEALCKYLIESGICNYAFAKIDDCFEFLFFDDDTCENCKFFAKHISKEEKERMLLENECVNKVGRFFFVTI